MSKRRDHLPRLSIAPNLNMQQPMGGPALFSPALPTSLQQSFHPSFPPNNPLQTPMQTFFNPPIMPAAPGRPTPPAAIGQLSTCGSWHPPSQLCDPCCYTFPPAIHDASSRKPASSTVTSLSKQEQTPAQHWRSSESSAAQAPPQKTKKVIVNLPKETVPGEDGEPSTRPSWARSPLDNQYVYEDTPVAPVETTTAEVYPPDNWRLELPSSIDVYLPGKVAWEAIKQKAIEEKLEKLGVERGSGSNVPHIHAPHARAASISSPADPALLLFKLNKLHQAQEGSSAGNSLTVSPQPPFVAPFGLSPSPNRGPHLTNRHGHTMSLAQPPSYQSSLFSISPTPFGTFGPNGALSSVDSEMSETPGDAIYAPQGRVPLAAPNFIPAPLSAVGGNKNQIDFARGFGLDIPLESEEESEVEAAQPIEEEPIEEENENDGDVTQDMELEEKYDGEIVEIDDGTTTASHSRLHSRHVSRLSAALSLRTVGGNFQNQLRDTAEDDGQLPPEEQDESEEQEVQEQQRQEVDSVEEWTGSEDVYLGAETSDDESIGEWSNPSDEERARQERVERRMRRRASQQQIDQPRRIPNFPRPPDNTDIFHSRREDDIISNPSEENLIMGHRAELLGVATEEYYPGTSTFGPAPHLPHSRVTSGQYSAHDPAMAHSRHGSENYHVGGFHQSALSAGRRESLNPFAKPPPMPVPNVATHTRLPSLGKPLNVAAPEFKPGSFNFILPGAPQMPLAQVPSAPAFPQPQATEVVESAESTPFKVQGREKRQRRDSDNSVVEEGDSMSSFRFPMKSSTQSIRRRRSGSLSGDMRHKLNPSAQPFTFAGFSAVANNMPWVPKESGSVDMPRPDVDENVNDSGTAKADDSNAHIEEISLPSATKPKRAPIPLDFKHPVSNNTVPAGLFKALVNSGDDRTRRGVRSRLSSREIFEHVHRPSMDDMDVALISHARQGSRNRLVTDPGERPASSLDDDVFTSIRHNRRRSSLPDALHDKESSPSEMSVPPQDLTTRMELHRIESIISDLLDEKLAPLQAELSTRERNVEPTVGSTTESMMADIISLFRAQLQESATRSLEDSQMDARGELDFQLLKDVVEESHKDLLASFQREAHRISQHVVGTAGVNNVGKEVVSAVEGVGQNTVRAVVEAISELSARQEAVALNAPARERDLIVDKLVTVLSPMFESLHNDPIDYEFLTRELTQAVKPHIAQLIDLASDKRETAGLIVDGILPLLPSLKNVSIDTEAITMKLITEVRRAIAPIDAFEIKEQVADLVVERLDSRLAVRDKAFNVDIVTSKVSDSVSQLLESLQTVPSAVEQLTSAQRAADERQEGLVTSQGQILASVTDIPLKIGSQLEEFTAAQEAVLKNFGLPTAHPVGTDANLALVKSIVETLANDQKKLAEQGAETLTQSRVLLDKLNTLPDALTGVVDGLQSTLIELITSRDNSKREAEELRKLNTDYQIQMTKARASHGQVRVEKDVVNEKLAIVEGDRDRLRAQVKELQSAGTAKVAETATLVARNLELEEALAKALARLQSTDVVAQANQSTITDLEKANRELSEEKETLRTKVTSLEFEVTFANREKDTATKTLEAVQKQHDLLVSQQSNWDILSAAAEKINMVYSLLENADDEEQQEFRHHRERSKALESENAALQKRLKEFEAKLANSEKASATARQTLTQAQQRSTEWERRAKEYEGQLEMVRTQLEQAEQTQSQLDADYSLVKLQLEEREADSRLVQDRENKLRDQITALESKCVLLQTELEKANASARLSASSTAPFRPQTNGKNHPTPRPDSRTSTIYDMRAETPTRRMSAYSSTMRSQTSPLPDDGPSVRDSMHAPVNGQSKWGPTSLHSTSSRYSSRQNVASTPKPRYTAYDSQYRAPSPTPSVVSVAPTQGEDGWWS
ncbi:hypothetical protein NLJ89_g3354 [Agrocybe chaxingu]|uniref:Uncharacterized protein n=1 Tax=Agrocybe chaxingu TaxID=84603 RepID=A0A9W8MWY5_9AGAR|nr:hypothetical protein NLJ89_g3354 [Agrocybe chaxingu]